jgi:hypothetical protein
MVAALLVFGTGCGGFYASPTFSPLMLLFPGFVQNKPDSPQLPGPGQADTNLTLAQVD